MRMRRWYSGSERRKDRWTWCGGGRGRRVGEGEKGRWTWIG